MKSLQRFRLSLKLVCIDLRSIRYIDLRSLYKLIHVMSVN